MAKVHSVNGFTINYIGQPNWIDRPVGKLLTGEQIKNRWRGHTWASNVMTVSEFNNLYTLEGTKATIVTTDYSSRNSDYITYYGAEVKRVTGTHDGPRFLDVQIEFLVRI